MRFSPSTMDGDGKGGKHFLFHRDVVFKKLLAKLKVDNQKDIENDLRVLNSLGVIHWLGDLASIRAAGALRFRVFNPEWIRHPVYSLIRNAQIERKQVLSEEDINRLLQARNKADEVGITLYHKTPFDHEDQSLVCGLMKACRLAFDTRDYGHLLIPDLLASTATGCRNDPPWKDFVTHWRLEMSLLPEKVFLRFLAKHWDDLKDKDRKCFRNEGILRVGDHQTEVLVHAVYSPPNGLMPRLEIIVNPMDANKESRAVMTAEWVRQEIREICKDEDLGYQDVTLHQGREARVDTVSHGKNVFRRVAQSKRWAVYDLFFEGQGKRGARMGSSLGMYYLMCLLRQGKQADGTGKAIAASDLQLLGADIHIVTPKRSEEDWLRSGNTRTERERAVDSRGREAFVTRLVQAASELGDEVQLEATQILQRVWKNKASNPEYHRLKVLLGLTESELSKERAEHLAIIKQLMDNRLLADEAEKTVKKIKKAISDALAELNRNQLGAMADHLKGCALQAHHHFRYPSNLEWEIAD